ncbi:MAG: release factor glutamine methyltransferase [Pseudonocardiales bacterium]|jgi:release factor glutamine methyltransferase|nr:release factor glutamine methyltransferase [Pseudonocardiales bacterium]MDQ1734076.1 release factor glutamine methyltransferase [Pseudonocardiales bacterium]
MSRQVRTELRTADKALATAGIASPRVDAELLLAHLLGVPRSALLLVDELTETQSLAFRELLARRGEGVPLQYLTGSAPFRYLDLVVGPGVFIPRPETELLLDLAAPRLANASVVVDLCAGSGAIALAVANEYPSVRVIAVERSAPALSWLRRNAGRQALAGDPQIEIVAADVSDPGLLVELVGRVDVVLSNPPYVPASLRTGLGREIAHDPDEAVFSGADGLELMPTVLACAHRLLRPSGLVAIEHDDSQGDTAPALLRSEGRWAEVGDHVDLAGRPRFVMATRQ